MMSITLKNIPQSLHRLLKRQASLNHRSLNREMIVCLESSVYSPRVGAEAFLKRVRKLRTRISVKLTDRFIASHKRRGLS
ncbi:MAG: DNA-binding protein [Chlamydiae bacterium]|nr:DNA-binding protein [Chlamydiota bacterium]MBI3278062.1 DNA-binding protein [Chlamydiota bacterium]